MPFEVRGLFTKLMARSMLRWHTEPTLDIALRRLSGCFEDFGFVVDTGRRLPNNMNDAGLAVVTAHRGLNREGR